MSLKTVTPKMASALIEQGAMLIDIRSADEHAREHIAAALHLPLEKLAHDAVTLNNAAIVIFYCRSGNRTQMHAQKLAGCTQGDCHIMEGGLDAWKKAGLPVVTNTAQPLELQRQVHIVAGTMIVLGAVLGATISPWFHLLSGLVGAGLIFAGLSGFCGLARLLMKMPWNKPTIAPQP